MVIYNKTITEISDLDLSDEECLEQLFEKNADVLENDDFMENIFDGTVSLICIL